MLKQPIFILSASKTAGSVTVLFGNKHWSGSNLYKWSSSSKFAIFLVFGKMELIIESSEDWCRDSGQLFSSAAVYACMKKYPIDNNACVVGIFADDGRKFKSVYAAQNVMSEDEFETSLKSAKHMSELAYWLYLF